MGTTHNFLWWSWFIQKCAHLFCHSHNAKCVCMSCHIMTPTSKKKTLLLVSTSRCKQHDVYAVVDDQVWWYRYLLFHYLGLKTSLFLQHPVSLSSFGASIFLHHPSFCTIRICVFTASIFISIHAPKRPILQRPKCSKKTDFVKRRVLQKD